MNSQLYKEDYLNQTYNFFKKIKEETYSDFLPLSDGIVLDVGCGLGADAIALAEILNPEVQVIGVDANGDLLKSAKAKAGEIKNLQWWKAFANILPFPSNSISGIRNERLIQHLLNDHAVYHEFFRVLKPGAPVVFVDTDWSSFKIYGINPEFDKRLKHFLVNQRIPNGTGILSLPMNIQKVGFEQLSIQVYPITSTLFDELNQLVQLEEAVDQMINLGCITKTEGAAFLSNLKTASATKSFVAQINFLVIKAKKCV